MKAHQRVVRERMAELEGADDLFGRYWEGINTDIKNMVVEPISRAKAAGVIGKYEWLGCMPAIVWYCFGAFFDKVLAGVVCYGPEYSENLGRLARERGIKCADWSKYGFEGKMILLSRGACVHWAHPHTGSKLIRRSMDMLPKKYEVVTSTCDPAAGEIGTIYQACGFHYVGSMREQNKNVQFREKDRHAWMIDGKIVGSRSMRALVGSNKKEDVARAFPQAVECMQYSKHRYFCFRGRSGRRHLEAIRHMILPYPKRTSEQRETV